MTYRQAAIDSSMPVEFKKCICIEFRIFTLICNNERPVKSLKVNFKRCHLVRSLRILKELDKKSQNHEISKYCKNIGMQKSTLKKMLIIPGRHGFSAFFIAWIKALVYAGEKSI